MRLIFAALIRCQSEKDITTGYIYKRNRFLYSPKKRKDSLESSLDQVLFATELDFPRILAPRLPQNTSNVNNECTRKSESSKNCVIYITVLFTDTS